MELNKYSIGVGDRFGMECISQLEAIKIAKEMGVDITPVWNKSFREHSLIGSNPEETKKIVDESVKKSGWKGNYFIDADHININSVDHFLEYANFFTIDVGDYINSPISQDEISTFLANSSNYIGKIKVPGVKNIFTVTENDLRAIAQKYLPAIKEAGKIYEHIKSKKNSQDFIVEISLDEVDEPQTPIEIFFILAAISYEKIPIRTMAPRFVGKFLKGIDYVGNVAQFEKEFEETILIVEYAKKVFSFNENLKISVHSGSDKFSIYGIINKIIKKYNVGLHLKTAGTTWLEELIGLTISEGKGLELVKEIYSEAFTRINDLLIPYKHSVEIDISKLPLPDKVNQWTSLELVSALRHDQSNKLYDLNLRQLFHISFRIASEKKERYYDLVSKSKVLVSKCVTENIYQRHIQKLFL